MAARRNRPNKHGVSLRKVVTNPKWKEAITYISKEELKNPGKVHYGPYAILDALEQIAKAGYLVESRFEAGCFRINPNTWNLLSTK